MNKEFIGYRLYVSKTDGRNISSKIISNMLKKKKFVTVSDADQVILDSYHETYRLSRFRDRNKADIHALYFCDKMRMKIVDNRKPTKNNKRAINTGTSCNNSATIHSRILKPLVKTLKDGKRLIDDSTTQKYKCLVIELFFRYKEFISENEGGDIFFFNQALNGLNF